MKKVLYIIVIMLLCFSLTSCKKKTNNDNENNDQQSVINDTIVFKKDNSLIKYYYMDIFLQKIELIYETDNQSMADGYINIYTNDSNKAYYSDASYDGKQVTILYSDEAINSYKNFSKEDLITYMKSIGYQIKK